MAKDKGGQKLTLERSMTDFKRAYASKRKLVEREHQDFLFALGEQWSEDDKKKLEEAGFKAFTDNRVQPNLFLLTGLERQNRTEFKAFPEGEEDGLKADIASALFKDAIKKSGFAYKSSEQFKDGITCGEAHLELYLDYTDSLLNGKPAWYKCDGSSVFPDPSSREYDFSDAAFVYKVKLDVAREDLINLYPEKRKLIEEAKSGKLRLDALLGASGVHRQYKDYPKAQTSSAYMADDSEEEGFDLLERYYKKWVERFFVGDKKTGEIKEMEGKDNATGFLATYRASLDSDQAAYQSAVDGLLAQHLADPAMAAAGLPREQHMAMLEQAGRLPPPPPPQDPDRFIVIKRLVPEIWVFAHVPGVDEPLADERAWFYPKWKNYPFIPYFARFSTAPLTGDDRHLLVQGLVHGVKGAQEKHNKVEMLTLRHLNSTSNSGWIAEEDSWVDRGMVKQFGATPGINLEYKKGRQKPERIFPVNLSVGHEQLSQDSAEAIKAQLGINADLLAAQDGGSSSGRAIALRQRQGLLMVQELFDNLARTRQIAGRFLLSQLGEIYDTETAMRVLGDGFMTRNFPAPTLLNPESNEMEPMKDEYGQPMRFDKAMAETAIAEVLSGQLEQFDVSVGETVASETLRLANSVEIKEMAQAYPGLIPPDILVRHSQLPESAKTEILSAIQQAQQARAAAAQAAAAPPTRSPGPLPGPAVETAA